MNFGFQFTNVDGILCFSSKKFFIATLPKIASSWLHEVYKNNDIWDLPENTILTGSNSVLINQINLESKLYDKPSYHVVEFSKEWNNLIHGNTTDKDFIFLIRNPIEKFIVGFMQELIYQKLILDSPDMIDLLEKYENKDDLKVFYWYKNNQIVNYKNRDWWHVPKEDWTIEIYNVISYLLKNVIDIWIPYHLNTQNIKELRNGHMTTNLFLCYKMIFNSKIDKNKLFILDIDKENIFNYINKNYDLDLNDSYNRKINDSVPILKNIIKQHMLKYKNVIDTIFAYDILLYCDLYNHLYSDNITPEVLLEKTFKNVNYGKI